MEGPRVQLVVTCLVDGLAPDVGRATLAALESAGCVVEYPSGQTCCGQPAFNVGLTQQAKEMAEHTLDVLDATEGPVVLPSGSCSEMIIHHYPRLFDGSEREETGQARCSTHPRADTVSRGGSRDDVCRVVRGLLGGLSLLLSRAPGPRS